MKELILDILADLTSLIRFLRPIAIFILLMAATGWCLSVTMDLGGEVINTPLVSLSLGKIIGLIALLFLSLVLVVHVLLGFLGAYEEY